MPHKILIANRGEIACRIQRACRALGIPHVSVYTDPDATEPHVTGGDEARTLGPEPSGYLQADRLLAIAVETGCDAVHPGYGFLAENAGFARAVESAGMAWIGPTPDSIADMGDKERARILAQEAGVPVLPGSSRFDGEPPPDLEPLAEAIGYPLLVKASGGGGGIGMRRVDKPADLRAAIRTTQELAFKAFGNRSVYLERQVTRARHVEVQVFGCGDGRALHLFERDCSLQRRFQKVVEESPAVDLPVDCRDAMYASAVGLTARQRYRGAGTVEFLYDVDRQAFYFLEMNTRIQVEHPVTEMVTGRDLVRMQIELAYGDRMEGLRQADVTRSGHAIECRLYAERPAKNYLPSTGTLSRFRLPEATRDLRVDTGVREGSTISFHYDPMLAKLVAWGPTREAAARRMVQALAASHVEGVQTNADLLARVMEHPAFLAGQLHTQFLDVHRDTLILA